MSTQKVGVTRFLGTNCDRDLWKACEELGLKPEWLWHEDQFNPSDYRAILIPGGFSYGDYLRCGALAAKSSVMKSVTEAAQRGTPILGICNGFQILCEAQLLPGVLLRNESLKFIDDWVELKSVTKAQGWNFSKTLRMPIAHGEGRYFVDSESLKTLQDQDQIWVTYASENPNGSVQDIAGVLGSVDGGKTLNIGGLMPHPERAMKDWMGSVDGTTLLAQFLQVGL